MFIGRVLPGNDLRQEAQGRHGRRLRMRAIARGASGGTVVRIVDAGDYSPKIWLRPVLRGQHLKGPMEPDLHGTCLACRQGGRSFAKWTAIFGHCERSFIFLARFTKKYEAASTDVKSSKTRNMSNVGYILGILECLIPPTFEPIPQGPFFASLL